MTVSEFEVVEVVNAVWQSMLGMECYDMGPEAALDEGPFITATVLITGAYEGGVTLQLSSSVGRNLAALMFGMETDEVSADDCIDAVGELATMVGGRAARNSPSGLTDSSSKLDFRIATPAGFGALAMMVRPPPVTAPATMAYWKAGLTPCTSEAR